MAGRHPVAYPSSASPSWPPATARRSWSP